MIAAPLFNVLIQQPYFLIYNSLNFFSSLECSIKIREYFFIIINFKAIFQFCRLFLAFGGFVP